MRYLKAFGLAWALTTFILFIIWAVDEFFL